MVAMYPKSHHGRETMGHWVRHHDLNVGTKRGQKTDSDEGFAMRGWMKKREQGIRGGRKILPPLVFT